jgi:hypothetical protein
VSENHGQASFTFKVIQEEEGKDARRGIKDTLQEGETLAHAMRELQEAPAWGPQGEGCGHGLPFKKPEKAGKALWREPVLVMHAPEDKGSIQRMKLTKSASGQNEAVDIFKLSIQYFTVNLFG